MTCQDCEITIVSIEGNIGSGKSTLLSNLKEHFKDNDFILFLKEPVDEWSNIKDEHNVTILEKFYQDQSKYSFPFQMMAYVSRLKLLRTAIKDIQEKHSKSIDKKNRYFIVTERSLFTDKMVFAKMLYDSGKIELINYNIYLSWFDTFKDEYSVDKIIYVKTDPDICHARIVKRNRDGETNIELDYLKSCSDYHDHMLNVLDEECVCKHQMCLDGNVNIYENEETLKSWILQIEQYILSKTT